MDGINTARVHVRRYVNMALPSSIVGRLYSSEKVEKRERGDAGKQRGLEDHDDSRDAQNQDEVTPVNELKRGEMV